ncbi:MAG: hypothetical protein HON53_19050 [Planctomycetaceae bacterium]|jgi:hypothetical protein|nr:hypothetical protein [Planctomycetaceae bacterium]MBT6156868.1 hypothetical protein [Planctomycetaceae bacterium]MBT6484180.1 hypothetical protein [Planctomycetaceae bacterium]MBT6496559.1 hypothetical protein [Planctomycetaceae bacterium]
MAERAVDQLTLRELFNDAERLTRELTEHIDQGFIPKSQALSRLVSPSPGDPGYDQIEDLTVRNQVAEVLKSEDFTNQLHEKLAEYYTAIERSVSRIAFQE